MDRKLQNALEAAFNKLPKKQAASLWNYAKKALQAASKANRGMMCGTGGLLDGLLADFERYQRAQENGISYDEQLQRDSAGKEWVPVLPFLWIAVDRPDVI